MLPQTSSYLALLLFSPSFNSHRKKQFFVQAFAKSLQQDHAFILLVPQTALVILLPRRLVKHRWIQAPLPALCLPQSGQASHASPQQRNPRNCRPPANPLLASATEGSRPHRLSCPLFDKDCSLLGKFEGCFGNAGGMQRIEKRGGRKAALLSLHSWLLFG